MIKNNNSNDQEISFLVAVFILSLCIIGGVGAVSAKFSFTGVGVFTSAGFSFLVASLALFIWAKITKESLKIKKHQIFHLIIRTLTFFVQFSLLYFGLSKTTASRGTLIQNLQPFFVLLLAHYLIPNDRLTKKKILGTMLGFIGLIFLFTGGKDLTGDFQIGDIIVLLFAFTWASIVIYLKKILHMFSPLQLTLYPMLFSIPLFFGQAFLWDNPMIKDLNLLVICSILFQGILIFGLMFAAWNFLLKKYKATTVNSFIFITPLSGVFLGWLLLNEPITFNLIISLFLIMIGILVVNWQPKWSSLWVFSALKLAYAKAVSDRQHKFYSGLQIKLSLQSIAVSAKQRIKNKPVTTFLWSVGIYIALFGFAANRYETRLQNIEIRMSADFAQLSTSNEATFRNLIARIPKFQQKKCPVKPTLFNPFSIIQSFCIENENQTIIKWSIETIENWKNRLQSVNLGDANLANADLRGANLQSVKLWNADLQNADLGYADLKNARLWNANLQNTDLWNADLQGARDLTIEQLSQVKTLYEAKLDQKIRTQVKQRYPHLLEEPKE